MGRPVPDCHVWVYCAPCTVHDDTVCASPDADARGLQTLPLTPTPTPNPNQAMFKDLEALKEVNRKKPEAAQAAYAKAKASMNVYLDAVELPPLGDQRYAS